MQHDPPHRFGARDAPRRTALVSSTQNCWRMRGLRLVIVALLMYQMFMSDNSIERLAKSLVDALPAGLRTMRDDLEQNFRSVLRSGLGKLDLVTREEFDVQRAVLARTREKLEALEARLADYENS